MTDNEIIKECRNKGLKNGSSLGFHSGIMDIIADRLEELVTENNRQRAEIERLTINMNAFGLGMKREKERADNARAEAIKEFAERLKEKKQWDVDIPDYVYVEDIDNLVKEMVGEG